METLVTKLPNSVSDESLFKIDEVVLKADFTGKTFTSSDQKAIKILCEKGAVIRIVGDGYFTDSSLTPTTTKEITVADWIENTYYVDGTTFSIYIGSVSKNVGLARLSLVNPVAETFTFCNGFWKSSNLRILKADKAYFEIELSDIKLDKIVTLQILNAQGEFSLSALENSSSLYELRAHETDLNGNISLLANSVGLTKVDVYSTNVEGSLETLLNKWKGVKKNSACSFSCYGTKVTYNGSSFDTKTATYDADGNYTVSGS